MKIIFILFLALLIVPFADSYAQVRNIDLTNCEKTTLTTVLYRPVNLNIKHDEAIVVDPEFIIPSGGQSITTNTPFAERDEFGNKRVNSGFSINGTGVYTIKWALDHEVALEGRLMEIFVQTAGMPMISDQIRYDKTHICRVWELQVSEQPLIPTDEEIVEVAYGIITPLIERVEQSVATNTDQIQRTSDRLSLIGIGFVVAFIIMVIIWHSSRKEKRELLSEYSIMKGRLQQYETQNIIESQQFQINSTQVLERLESIIRDFHIIFNSQVERKTNDLGFVIHHFLEELRKNGFNIPQRTIYVDENWKKFADTKNPSSENYVPLPAEHDIIEKPRDYSFITDLIKSRTKKHNLFGIFKRKDSTDEFFEQTPEVKPNEVIAQNVPDLQKQWDELRKKYDDPDTPNEEKSKLVIEMNELNEKIREAIKLGN